MPSAFAVTRGARHVLVSANNEFLRLVAMGEQAVGRPIDEAIGGRNASELRSLLDGVLRTGAVTRDGRIKAADGQAPAWYLSAWPAKRIDGEAHLVIEIRRAGPEALRLDLQRELAERMLLGALREREAAERAEAFSKRSTFLAAESRRLVQSLDESVTLSAIAELALPQPGAWCFVDLLNADATVRRLPISHPESRKHALVEKLGVNWRPQPADEFGIPAALRSRRTTIIANGLDVVFASCGRDPEIEEVLRGLNIGSLLTIPLVIRDVVVGAITFVAVAGGEFSQHDVELAEELAARSAIALESARLHREAVVRQRNAESANDAKSAFLGTMSHELRTPLAAIGGYLDIIDMGLHGPVTEAQHSDLSRMRHSLEHLVRLISDILTIVRLGKQQVLIDTADVRVIDVLNSAVELVEPLLLEKQLSYDGANCEPTVVMHADSEKVVQILVNLLSNAIKFTPSTGQVGLVCETGEQSILIRVSDSGIGIPADKLDAIFEPFVQVHGGLTSRGTGVGLGLAISRDLARAMNGDLTVESTLGAGSRFTLALPRGNSAGTRIR